MTSAPSTSTLSAIGSSSEPSGDVRPCRRASRPSNKSVVIATQKTRGRPVRVTVERPREEDDDDRDGERPRDGQLIGGAHAAETNTARCMFDKVLVANRGEIAVRDLPDASRARRSARSPSTRRPIAARSMSGYADEAFLIGPPPAAESYLKVERLIETALRAGAQAVHPGYGFLAENAAFARAVEDAGLVWIGPPPDGDRADGRRRRARGTAMQRGGRADHSRHDRSGRRRSRSCSRSASRSAIRC